MTHTLAQIRAYYDNLAPDYEAQIVVPAFRPFAQGVIQTAQPQGVETALDIGTGTGVLARLLAPHVRHVVGVDLADGMIHAGRALAAQEGLTNLQLEVGNAHRLPYPDQSFELVVSSFGLNATSPSLMFPEIHRLLKVGGVLAFHEWNESHPLDPVLGQVMADYILDDSEISEELFELREFVRSPRPWDNVFQSAEDYHDTLQEYGFGEVHVWEDAPTTLHISIPDFIAYKSAWKNRREELAAMPPPQRADCLDALHQTLAHWADSEGYLTYDPILFRVRALKLA